ncbi:MAG: hypothetical protein A2201_07275 [Alicyclobacillus sp. RIFOXYA1_FULL_53_8]|nr:MAG: hypothetical protein A2201_07275 [Alicyclobacillus sp. RIFOXYA1_FULL_53_8]
MQRISEILRPLQGDFGLYVLDSNGDVLLSEQASTRFPLASAAKVAVGWAITQRVLDGTLDWQQKISELVFDPKEDSADVYPHLQGLHEYELRDVVEVMIACHDGNCANGLANLIGGWGVVQSDIAQKYPRVSVHQAARDEERNSAELAEMVRMVQEIVKSYPRTPSLWKPVLAGLVRQQDKTDDIPRHRLMNMTGGLATAMIDVGVMGSIHDGNYIVYGIAGKNLADRASAPTTDEAFAEVLRQLYLVTLP